MGKSKKFEIFFDNNGIFCAGQLLGARLILELDEQMKAESIRISIKGKAKTSWTKSHGKTSTHYSDQEVYFDYNFDSMFASQFTDKVIPAGHHEIKFNLQLPSQLPSSYEGSYGHIRYVCSAVMERSWKFDMVCKKVFFVVALEDLNAIPDLAYPFEINDTQTIHCCCVQRGMVTFRFQMPKRGFVPGEAIPIDCLVANNSRKTIRRVLLRLEQYTLFRGHTVFLNYDGTKEVKLEVTRLNHPTVIAPGQTESVQLSLQVPSIPPRLLGCRLIDISYQMKVSIGSLVKFSVALIIGTVPIRGPQPSYASVDQQNLAVDMPPVYVETPPPSYRDCVTGLPNASRNRRFFFKNTGDNDSVSDLELIVPKYCYYGAT